MKKLIAMMTITVMSFVGLVGCQEESDAVKIARIQAQAQQGGQFQQYGNDDDDWEYDSFGKRTKRKTVVINKTVINKTVVNKPASAYKKQTYAAKTKSYTKPKSYSSSPKRSSYGSSSKSYSSSKRR
ncbi:hypothetical protein N9937_00145 [bacterium]|nr:hypothetical protein [bacterium]